MSQMERIAFLDRRLGERGWVTAAEAADHFGVSTRQVKRDIEYLRWRLDAPVAYDPVNHRYLYEKPYTKLRFTDERRVLFSAVVKGLAASEAFRPLVNREILDTVTSAVARDYRVVADRIRYEAPAAEPADLEIFAGLCRGLRDGKCVDLVYVNLGGDESRRKVEVQRLVNYGGTWYLGAFDHSRSGLRTFHLGRVKGLTVTPEPVTKVPGDPKWEAEVEAWAASGTGIFRGGDPFAATVRLRGQARRLAASQKWHPDQADVSGTDLGGAFLDRTVPVVDTRELLGRVLAFGADAEVREPREFRDRWAQEIQRMAAVAGEAVHG